MTSRRVMRGRRGWLVGCLLLAGAAGPALARDYLDSFNGRGWSPDSEWLAFNPVNKDDLFFIAPRTGRSYLLSPLGDVNIDLRGVFSAEPSIKTTKRTVESQTVTVPSPGKSKLESVEWSPDSHAIAYTIDRKTRGIFSLTEQAVTGRVSATELLPWQTESDLRIAFEFVASAKDREARYWLRVVQPTGKILKEVSFENPKELRQISLLRFTEANVLSPDKRFLLYPRLQDKGWQLVQDDITGTNPPRPLTAPAAEAPLEWKVSPDSRYLAVVQSPYALAIGAIDDWAHAENVPLPNLPVTISWSPDGRFLAATDKQQLYLLQRSAEGGRIVGDFFLVSDFCAPTFWGWRGSRLYFGDARTDPSNLFVVDTDHPRRPEQLVKTREQWQSAARYRSIAPDGKTLVCLMMEIDSEGRLIPQLWKIALVPGASWQLLYTFRP